MLMVTAVFGRSTASPQHEPIEHAIPRPQVGLYCQHFQKHLNGKDEEHNARHQLRQMQNGLDCQSAQHEEQKDNGLEQEKDQKEQHHRSLKQI